MGSMTDSSNRISPGLRFLGSMTANTSTKLRPPQKPNPTPPSLSPEKLTGSIRRPMALDTL